MDSKTNVGVVRKPRETFIKLINDVIKNEGSYTDTLAEKHGFHSMKELCSAFNKGCIYYQLIHRLVYISDMQVYVLTSIESVLEDLSAYMVLGNLPNNILNIIMSSAGKPQDRLEYVIRTLIKDSNTIELPTTWSDLFGYKNTDNFRDSIHRAMTNITGSKGGYILTRDLSIINKNKRQFYFSYIIKIKGKKIV